MWQSEINVNLLFLYYIPVIVLSIFALVAAAIDVWKLKIYNVITIPLILSGITYHVCVGLYLGEPGTQALRSVAGLFLGLGILIVPWLMGGTGAGDVKLMGAVGAWLGAYMTFWVFIVSALAQGVVALVLIARSHSFRDTWTRLQIIWLRVAAFGQFLGKEDSLEQQVDPKERRSRLVPFGAMLFLGLGIVTVGILFGWLQLN